MQATNINQTQLLEPPNRLQLLLDKEDKSIKQESRINIANYKLPSSLEDKGIICFGSPGSGKSLTINKIIAQLKQRKDYRFVILDRNGEFGRQFYDSQTDITFTPDCENGYGWDSGLESANSSTIASSLIPEDASGDSFWSSSAKNLLTDILDIADNNLEANSLLHKLEISKLAEILTNYGKSSARFCASEKMAASVIASATTHTRFYNELATTSKHIDFTGWARGENPSNLFLPLFEENADVFKPLYSMVFNLIIRGLLSNQQRKIKTAIIIDELGALAKIPALSRLVAEGRKFKATPILATQTTAQLDKIYGHYDREILLQSIATKLILNCRDYRTANTMAEIIGRKSTGGFTVAPGKIQNLPPLQGYLKIAHHPVTEAALSI